MYERTSWIKSIDINAEVYGLLRSYSFLDLVNNAVYANRVNFPSFNDLETAIPVVLVVTWTG